MKKIVRTSPDAPCIDCGVAPKHSHARCKPCRNKHEQERRKCGQFQYDTTTCNDCGIKPRRGKKSVCLDCHNKRERERYAAIPYEVRTKRQLERFYKSAENNRAINRKNRKKRYWDNPERDKAAFKEYREANPDKFKAYANARRAREIGAEGHFTDRDWQNIVYLQQSCCMSCGVLCQLTIDHIVPLSRGGTNWPDNLQGLCKSCNSSKSNSLDYQFIIPPSLHEVIC